MNKLVDDQILFDLLQEIGCSSLEDIHPHKVSDFVKAAISGYLNNSYSLLELVQICEEMLAVIPTNRWVDYEELDLVLKIADLAWYLEQGKNDTHSLNDTLEELWLFSQNHIVFN